jgi:uncharacterized protein (TIGR02145 family)
MKKLFGIICLCFFLTNTIIAQSGPCPDMPTVIYAGKTYNTILIGNKCWLKENLDVGIMILGIDTAKNNGVIEKYCYNNDTNNCNTYGGLYKWNEAMQYDTKEGIQGICPTGWHVPTFSEFQALSTIVGANGNALKAIGQGSGVGTGTDASGFSVLLSGYMADNGVYSYLNINAHFWSSTQSSSANANLMGLLYSDTLIYLHAFYKTYGFCVRCVNDNDLGVDDNDKSELPKNFLLLQNYPNPFNPTTTINYQLSKQTHVTLKVFDFLGREVVTLVNGIEEPGYKSVTFDASLLPSGVYFYRLHAGTFVQTNKMLLIK